MSKCKIDGRILGPIGTNVYLCFNDETKEGFIVDPVGDITRIDAMIQKNEVKLVGVLLTHGHFDHIGAADTVREKYGVKIYASELEAHTLADPEFNRGVPIGGVQRSLKADVSCKDGEVLDLAGFQVQCLSTPGHTEGGMCYYIAEEDVLFAGDTLFAGTVGRTDLPGGSMGALVNSIKSKLSVLPDSVNVFPGHGGLTTIQDEKKVNPFL